MFVEGDEVHLTWVCVHGLQRADVLYICALLPLVDVVEAFNDGTVPVSSSCWQPADADWIMLRAWMKAQLTNVACVTKACIRMVVFQAIEVLNISILGMSYLPISMLMGRHPKPLQIGTLYS
jgi:hypothetical protein